MNTRRLYNAGIYRPVKLSLKAVSPLWYICLFLFMIVSSGCNKNLSTSSKLEEFDYKFSDNGSVSALPVVLPHLYINTENNTKIESREEYLEGYLSVDGKGVYDNYEGKIKIRARGHTSWRVSSKKPYKLKLKTESALLGLPAAKNWILLAEYLDGSMLYNSVPYSTGHLLNIPYTHHIIPVEISINGEYRGIYVFTEHKEGGPNRIDVGTDGVVLSFDASFDGDWQFKSASLHLPVMVEYPEPEDMNPVKLSQIQSEYEKFEKYLKGSFPNDQYSEYLDVYSFVDYLIVNDLTLNQEIFHPKSVYMNKQNGGKYRMGIIWDFDYGFGYANDHTHYDMNVVNNPVLPTSSSSGSFFFNTIMKDSRVKKLYAERWMWFRSNKYEQLKQYILNYAEVIRLGYANDHERWGPRDSSDDLDADVQRLLTWLDARAKYMDGQADKYMEIQ